MDAGDYYHVIRPLLDLCLCSPVKINVFLGALAGGLYIGMAYGAGCGICEAYIDKVSRASGFEFGRARMFGGIGAAIGTFAAGKLYGIDQNMIFWLASGAGVCLLVIVWKMQISAHPQQGLLSGKASPVTLRDAVSLLKIKNSGSSPSMSLASGRSMKPMTSSSLSITAISLRVKPGVQKSSVI